ncbi:MAG TPA: monovalent cation/H+ antiporter complex subunit F [Candidatus Binatia bacterium]|nr:monovalent cation/H+ antiporter complex subunit F [Candidatus Binatia bacterium]
MTLAVSVSTASYIALCMMSLAIVLAAVRLIRGPSLPDRVVALDLISILVAGTTAIYAIASGQAVFLDVATILALISFLGTAAFARYIEKQVSQ